PHLFRDIAATFVSEEAPGDRAIVANVLGHTNLATSQMHYDHAGSLRAQQRLVDVIDRIARDEMEPKERNAPAFTAATAPSCSARPQSRIRCGSAEPGSKPRAGFY